MILAGGSMLKRNNVPRQLLLLPDSYWRNLFLSPEAEGTSGKQVEKIPSPKRNPAPKRKPLGEKYWGDPANRIRQHNDD